MTDREAWELANDRVWDHVAAGTWSRMQDICQDYCDILEPFLDPNHHPRTVYTLTDPYEGIQEDLSRALQLKISDLRVIHNYLSYPSHKKFLTTL